MSDLDPAIGIILRASLALLFLGAAMHKLRDMRSFRAALAGYELLPDAGVRAAAWLIVSLEAAITVGLCVSRRGGPAAAALLTLYNVAIAVNLRRGRSEIECGCAGPAGRLPLSCGLIVRNLILIAAAVFASLPASSRQLVWLDAFTVVAGVSSIGFLYAAAETVLANASRGTLFRDRVAADNSQSISAAMASNAVEST